VLFLLITVFTVAMIALLDKKIAAFLHKSWPISTKTI